MSPTSTAKKVDAAYKLVKAWEAKGVPRYKSPEEVTFDVLRKLPMKVRADIKLAGHNASEFQAAYRDLFAQFGRIP